MSLRHGTEDKESAGVSLVSYQSGRIKIHGFLSAVSGRGNTPCTLPPRAGEAAVLSVGRDPDEPSLPRQSPGCVEAEQTFSCPVQGRVLLPE